MANLLAALSADAIYRCEHAAEARRRKRVPGLSGPGAKRANFIGFFKNFDVPLFGGSAASILWE